MLAGAPQAGAAVTPASKISKSVAMDFAGMMQMSLAEPQGAAESAGAHLQVRQGRVRSP